MEFAHGIPVVHGVESGHLIYTHGGHLEQSRHLVHDTDAGEAMLSLAEVKKRHDGGLFVLRRVSRKHLLDELFIDLVELEGDIGVVLWSVSVLHHPRQTSLVPPVVLVDSRAGCLGACIPH